MLLIFLMITFTSPFAFSKDTTTYKYEGKKADILVGILGGTGCVRHWDVLDTHDATHLKPFDICGKYGMVSLRYHKWVDLQKYGPEHRWWSVRPIQGDGVLEQSTCKKLSADPIYILKQYAECGGEGQTIAVCDEAGADLTDAFRRECQ